MIEIKFKGDSANFKIETENDKQLFTALMGLESYVAAKLNLTIGDIREILDEVKSDLTLKDSTII